jgi:16S rRNA processing protein RimM
MTSELFHTGRIAKTRGYDGTLVLVSYNPLDDDMDNINEVFILIDGLQTPFPVVQSVLTTDTSANIQLEFVNSQNEAQKLIGCDVYSAVTYIKQETEAGLEQWTGLTVYDEKYGKIGVIHEVKDYNGNIVLQVIENEKETLISLYPELITGIDNDAKLLHIKAPEGYF